MRIDLSDLERLDGFAEALARLFWCLMALALFAALLGSAGTGFFLLVLGSLAFVGRAGLEDFVQSRRASGSAVAEAADADHGITIHRAKGSRRRSKSAV